MLLTAVMFIGPITTVIVTVTDPLPLDTSTCVSALELVVSACYTLTCKILTQ